MRKVFTSSEIGEAVLVRDALLHRRIEANIQNQHSSSTAVHAFRIPAEVWIRNESELGVAREIVSNTLSRLDDAADDEPWACAACKEQNPRAFEVCWNCDRDRPDRT